MYIIINIILFQKNKFKLKNFFMYSITKKKKKKVFMKSYIFLEIKFLFKTFFTENINYRICEYL